MLAAALSPSSIFTYILVFPSVNVFCPAVCFLTRSVSQARPHTFSLFPLNLLQPTVDWLLILNTLNQLVSEHIEQQESVVQNPFHQSQHVQEVLCQSIFRSRFSDSFV